MDAALDSQRSRVKMEWLNQINRSIFSLVDFCRPFREDGGDPFLFETMELLQHTIKGLELNSDGLTDLANQFHTSVIESRIQEYIGGGNPTLLKAIEAVHTLRSAHAESSSLNLFPENVHGVVFQEVKRRTKAVSQIIEKLQMVVIEVIRMILRTHSAIGLPGEPNLTILSGQRNALSAIFEAFVARKSVFVYEKPSSVLVQMMNLSFSMISESGCEVKMYLIDEDQVRNFEETEIIPSEIEVAGGLYLGDQEATGQDAYLSTLTVPLTASSEPGVYDVELSNLHLIRDPNKKHGSSIQRLFLLVVALLQGNEDKSILARTRSVPLLLPFDTLTTSYLEVTKHRHKTFSNMVRLPFKAYSTWSEIEVVVTDYIKEVADIFLTAEERTYLKSVLSHNFDNLDKMSLDAFFGQWMVNTTFSFWTWICKYCELLQKNEKYFGNFVRKGYITGFIGRDDVQRLLRQPGDFVVSCSETHLGSFSITFMHRENLPSLPILSSHFVELDKCAYPDAKFLDNIHNLQLHVQRISAEQFPLSKVVSPKIPDGVLKSIAFPKTVNYRNLLQNRPMSFGVWQHARFAEYLPTGPVQAFNDFKFIGNGDCKPETK